MDTPLTRRDALRGGALAAAATAGVAWPSTAEPRGEPNMTVNVRDHNAAGDGATDDTAAFQAALDQAGEAGGGVVTVPRGDYLIGGRLVVPDHVTLEGTWRAPITGGHHHGSTLLATAGRGEADGEPFISLRTNATLSGLTVFYPEQTAPEPTPYPWCVRQVADNASLINVLLVNPYQAVDCGTVTGGRHFISGLYAQALKTGLKIDRCFDVGRVENVHFWPFWNHDQALWDWQKANGTAFQIGRTDWEYMFNCFCIFYRLGFHFAATEAGAPNAVLTQCGSDIGPTAVRVSDCQAHAGVAFANSQFMAGIEVEATNTGPVKFTGCGFWFCQEPNVDHHAQIAGRGHVTFNGCHFIDWDKAGRGSACIDHRAGGLTVTGCDFMDAGKAQVAIGPDIDAALVYGNRLRGAEGIRNEAGAKAQVALNVVSEG